MHASMAHGAAILKAEQAETLETMRLLTDQYDYCVALEEVYLHLTMSYPKNLALSISFLVSLIGANSALWSSC